MPDIDLRGLGVADILAYPRLSNKIRKLALEDLMQMYGPSAFAGIDPKTLKKYGITVPQQAPTTQTQAPATPTPTAQTPTPTQVGAPTTTTAPTPTAAPTPTPTAPTAPLASPSRVTSTGPAGSLTGEADVLNPAYGGRPLVPDPRGTAGQAIGATAGNVPAINQILNQFDPNRGLEEQRLGSLISTPTGTPASLAGGVTAANVANLPNLYNIVQQVDPMIDKSRALTGDFLAGKVPQDVINLIGQQAAERGVATGNIGSPNANAALLRALGLTSLGLQQYGQGEEGRLAGEVAGIEQPFMVTPQQEAASRLGQVQTGLTGANQLSSRLYGEAAPFFVSPGDMQAAQMAANLYASAPEPTLAAQEAQRLQQAGAAAGNRGFGSFAGAPLGGVNRATPASPREDPSHFLDPFNISSGPTGVRPPYQAPQTTTPTATTAPDPMAALINSAQSRSAQLALSENERRSMAQQWIAMGYDPDMAMWLADQQISGGVRSPTASPAIDRYFGVGSNIVNPPAAPRGTSSTSPASSPGGFPDLLAPGTGTYTAPMTLGPTGEQTYGQGISDLYNTLDLSGGESLPLTLGLGTPGYSPGLTIGDPTAPLVGADQLGDWLY